MSATGQLLPQHAALLGASAISDEVALARGYRSVERRARLTELGFSSAQARVPALLIPIWNIHGEVALHQLRPDEPRIDNRGRAVKYETVARARMVLDVPPAVRDKLGDPAIPLWFTEGVRKADAAVSAGLCCVALLGVWNWRGTNEQGGKVALADFESIALNGRAVVLAFDSDVVTKPEVRLALERLRAFLESRGAHARIVHLPAGEGGTKTGLDDYLAAGHTVDELLALASDEIPDGPSSDRPGTPYRTSPAGITHLRESRDGTVEVRLTNFGAQITLDIVEDDGAEERRFFEIEASLGGRTRTFRVGAPAFGAMVWPAEHLGAGAVVYPGFASRDHARAAIQLLSGTPPERRVFTHTGWRTVGGRDVYLHAGGAIGSEGTVAGIEVRLETPLDRFLLPDPPLGEVLHEAVRASLGLLDLAPDGVAFPLLGAIYRAPLGECDLSVHLTGPTGVFKTELAALAQAHWGAGLDARHLPGSWSSTPNANEGLASLTKDAICVVDDFAPGGSRMDVGRLHHDADRLLRAQGNRSGRARMRVDASLRPPRPPRGLIVSTGEDVPRGASLGARMIVGEVGPGDVDGERLTACQADAATGRFAAAMAGYVRWLASQGQAARVRLRQLSAGDGLATPGHHRIARNLQTLGAGVRAFLLFARDADAVEVAEEERLWSRAVAAFMTLSRSQGAQQAACDPARSFIELLGSAIASGRVHVAGQDGRAPAEPAAWGWRFQSDGLSDEGWRAQGTRVGWVDGDELYLGPAAAFAAAQAVGTAIDTPITLAPRTLHQRVNEAGLLRSTESERGHLTVRRVLEGSRRSVLHLASSSLHELAQPAPPSASDAARGPFAGASSIADPSPFGPQKRPGAAQAEHVRPSGGPDGPLLERTNRAMQVGVLPQGDSPDGASEEQMTTWTR